MFEQEILKVKRDLRQIKETGRAPINLTLYKYKLGLVQTKYKTTKTGHRIFDKLTLTPKGKNILYAKEK